MTSAMSLSATSTEFTTDEGVRYTWTGLTVDRQNCRPDYIEFTDMSFINLESDYVFVTPGTEAIITITAPGNDPVVTHSRTLTPQPRSVQQNVTIHGSGSVTMQGSGVQVNIF